MVEWVDVMTKEERQKLEWASKRDATIRLRLECLVAVEESGGCCACDGAVDDGCYNCTRKRVDEDLERIKLQVVNHEI